MPTICHDLAIVGFLIYEIMVVSKMCSFLLWINHVNYVLIFTCIILHISSEDFLLKALTMSDRTRDDFNQVG